MTNFLKSITVIFLVFFSCTLTSCLDFFAIKKKIKDDYFLIAGDFKSECNISIKVYEGGYLGVVPQTIIEYAVTDTFIFAKQLRLYDFEHENFDKFNYYVIRIGEDKSRKIERNEFANFLKANDLVMKNIKWKKTW